MTKIQHPVRIDWEQYKNWTGKNAFQGTVAVNNRGLISVLKDHKITNATLHSSIPGTYISSITVGDEVEIEKSEYNYFIRYRLPRRNFLSRARGDRARKKAEKEQVLAANVDIAIIVASTEQPHFQPRFIDRYLIICEHGNVKPIICLNKTDLSTKRHPILSWYQKELGIPIIETSIISGKGVETLRNAVQNSTCVFLGHSGVGKSSLINALKENLNLKTSSVSKKTGKGKHTTTSFNLYPITKDSYIIDTPGIRSLGLSHIKKKSLRTYFPEFVTFQTYCKYLDCLHDAEHNCAVKNAVQRGEINQYRYQSYLKILQELRA
ncbi:ribosome small subunit-dependent GTPase A [Patescibacteria group bacterium]|nr:ribosome small subunit-dependent GTPase A [Patescibacteria group bacterium]